MKLKGNGFPYRHLFPIMCNYVISVELINKLIENGSMDMPQMINERIHGEVNFNINFKQIIKITSNHYYGISLLMFEMFNADLCKIGVESISKNTIFKKAEYNMILDVKAARRCTIEDIINNKNKFIEPHVLITPNDLMSKSIVLYNSELYFVDKCSDTFNILDINVKLPLKLFNSIMNLFRNSKLDADHLSSIQGQIMRTAINDDWDKNYGVVLTNECSRDITLLCAYICSVNNSFYELNGNILKEKISTINRKNFILAEQVMENNNIVKEIDEAIIVNTNLKEYKAREFNKFMTLALFIAGYLIKFGVQFILPIITLIDVYCDCKVSPYLKYYGDFCLIYRVDPKKANNWYANKVRNDLISLNEKKRRREMFNKIKEVKWLNICYAFIIHIT